MTKQNLMNDFNIKLFADGANLSEMLELSHRKYIAGLTTNPTLMRKAGVTDYVKFAKNVLLEIKDKPISFEVFTDDIAEMIYQGQTISSWGENVYVKIPITNTLGQSTEEAVNKLSHSGVKVNVTAVMTSKQFSRVYSELCPEVPSIISVFAGRIADTGVDPVKFMSECVTFASETSQCEILWASPRELLNIVQANAIHCDIITCSTEILNKLHLIGYDLDKYSLDTVKMFHTDAKLSGYRID
jgi:transaldolase